MDDIFYYMGFVFAIANTYNYGRIQEMANGNKILMKDFLMKLFGAQLGGVTEVIQQTGTDIVKEMKGGKSVTSNILSFLYPIWIILGIIYYDHWLFVFLFTIGLSNVISMFFKSNLIQKAIVVLFLTEEIAFTVYIIYNHYYNK